MIDKKALLDKYSANLPEGRSKNHFVSYAKAFLEYAEDLDRKTIERYIAKLKRDKMSPGTINFAFRVVRTLFARNGIEWPFPRGAAPPIGQRDEYKPALQPELIKVMVEAAKDGKLDADSACFLALSTVYGLRREEMVDLKSADVDFDANTIYIATLKGGRERYHLIPDEIKPYLEAHNFDERYSLGQMSQMFWRVVNGAGLQALQQKRLGWHSIRRTVKTLLDNSGLSPISVHNYMRWKAVESEFAMDVRYHASHFVGLETTTVMTQEAEGDKEVFEKHPLLPYWR